MVKYLFASHGTFAGGTKSFFDVMVSKRDDVYVLEAFLDNRGLDELIENTMNEIGEFEQLIVFCDLYGSSVASKFYQFCKLDPRNIKVIAGYNLALAMDLIYRGTVLSDLDILESIALAKDSIRYLNNIEVASSDDELF